MDAFDRVRAELKALAPPAAGAHGTRTVAVLLPCHNAEATIAGVIDGFRRSLPHASIHVYDNNSSDRTAHAAGKAGAVVRRESFNGKANLVRRMFADIDADIYVLADGDSTCDPAVVDKLIGRMVAANVDMVVGARGGATAGGRRGRAAESRLLTRMVSGLLGAGFSDIFSGYRVFSRRFAKSFTAASPGFALETELSIHALDLDIATAEILLPRGAAPAERSSLATTARAGCKTLWTIAMMMRALRPLRFYGAVCGLLALSSLGLGYPVVATYLTTGLVPRLPTALMAVASLQLAFLSLACGLVVEAISDGRREARRLRYLDQTSVAASAAPQWQEPRVVSSQIL